MHVHSHLDVEVVALEEADTVHVLLELQAPAQAEAVAPRLPQTVVVVLDRSGSMGGERLDAARAALLTLIERLDPTDRLGVVAFDHVAEVVIPAGPLGGLGKAQAKELVSRIEARGNTDLSSGDLRGLQEAKRATGDAGATLVLLSDGHANSGVTEPEALEALARDARAHGITTSTIGVGLGYDETVLVALTRGGQGNHVFAELAEAAGVALTQEIDGLLSKTVQAASLLVKPGPDIHAVTLLNDLPSTGTSEGVLIELGDFYSEEERRVVLAIHVPGRAALGLAQIAEIVLTHVEMPALVEHTITLPINVNVVPGDEAAGRVAKPEVARELLLLEAQKAKVESERLMREGDMRAASALLISTSASMAAAPYADEETLGEVAWLQASAQSALDRDADYNLKRSVSDRARKSRGSRDPRRGGEI